MKIAFIFAHPDDESYGPAGTIIKLAKNNEVFIVSLCNGTRPGNENVSANRLESFNKICSKIGVKNSYFDFFDCTLEYENTLKVIENIIQNYKPEIVYTNNISDIHKDHRLVAECCMVACRPKPNSSVKSLYFSEMPSSTSWSFNKIQPYFQPNVYENITEQMNLKKELLSLYETEIYPQPDARSVYAMETLAKYRGYESGYEFAESFNLVFDRKE